MNAEDAMAAKRDQGSEIREMPKRKRDDRQKETKGEAEMRDSANRSIRPRKAQVPVQRAQVYPPPPPQLLS